MLGDLTGLRVDIPQVRYQPLEHLACPFGYMGTRSATMTRKLNTQLALALTQRLHLLVSSSSHHNLRLWHRSQACRERYSDIPLRAFGNIQEWMG